MIYPALAVVSAAQWSGWVGYAATAALFVMAGAGAHQGLSRKEFEAMHAKDQSLNRTTWTVNWVLFFAVWPVVLWAALVIPRILR